MKLITLAFTALLMLAMQPVANRAHAQQDPKLPTIRIIFFTPSDVSPPEGVNERLTQIAKYTEAFFFKWMKHWGYEPAAEHMFQWNADGTVEVLFAKGDQPADKVVDGSFRPKMIQQLTKEHKIPRNGNINWIFVYKGDPPARFDKFVGSGNSKAGGWATANYLSAAGSIRLDKDIAEGFHDDFALKGCIHEFGHALGLPHQGPRLKHKAGNTLMGPVTRIWERELGHKDGRGYLSEGSAAMLWKHPIFSGTARKRGEMPRLNMLKFEPSFEARKLQIEINGRVASDAKVHSVIVIDDMDKKPGAYWVRPYVSRVDKDGNFQVIIDEPIDSGGTYRVMFCFDNGVVTGDGKRHGTVGAIDKKYTYARGTFRFD